MSGVGAIAPSGQPRFSRPWTPSTFAQAGFYVSDPYLAVRKNRRRAVTRVHYGVDLSGRMLEAAKPRGQPASARSLRARAASGMPARPVMWLGRQPNGCTITNEFTPCCDSSMISAGSDRRA